MSGRQRRWNEVFSLKGRIGRTRYLGCMGGVAFGAFASFYALVDWRMIRFAPPALTLVLALFTLPFCIRRLHDLNLSAWWILLCHPLVNFGAFLALAIAPGMPGANRYGLPPSPARRSSIAFAIVSLPFHFMVCVTSQIYCAFALVVIYRAIESPLL